MGLSAEIRQQLIANFQIEQREHIQKINQGLLALEKNPSEAEQKEWLKEIFREAHSLKGAARAVGMTTAESIGHALESILLQARDGQRTLSPEIFDLMYQSLDAVELVLQQAESGKTTPSAKVLMVLAALEEATAKDVAATATFVPQIAPTEIPPEPPPPAPSIMEEKPLVQPMTNHVVDETIRVSVNKMDLLMAEFSELLATKIRIEQRLTEVRDLQGVATQWQKNWHTFRGAYTHITRQNDLGKDMLAMLNFMNQSQEQVRQLSGQTNLLYRQFSNDTMRLSLVIEELQEKIKQMRMMPLATITTTFERMVRDLARQHGKLIRLTIVGGETELDKRVLEQIKDPILHLLRNAVDHGLESPKERQQFGKPIEGEIILAASQQGQNVVIQVKDNGRGLDLAAIRAAASRQGLITMSESERLTPHETAMLIFNSGLTTSPIITDISGRGVGMDVVRQNVAELQGTINVDFILTQGTTITLTLPLTLASSRGLLVQVAEEMYALPFTNVERMLEVTREEIGQVEGQEVITYQGQAVALVWLVDLLELPTMAHAHDKLLVVIVNLAEKRLGLVVDSLMGEQEIVMKSLGRQLTKVSGIAGATVLGSGKVVLVLHAADLIKLATHVKIRDRLAVNAARSTPQGVQSKLILVVDDSITTRTLEKNILESAGYLVKLATNGEEAMSRLLADNLPHLIVTDVNMPHLDGFELTQRVKQNPRYNHIPIILVTSLDSPADKARGIEVGADAYIVKSHFDQTGLLDTIQQLI